MPENRGLLSYETLVHAIAGATGSVVGMAAFYPLDTVRCRLQLEEANENGHGRLNGNGHANGQASTSHAGAYTPTAAKDSGGLVFRLVGASTLRALHRVASTEGAAGLYRGVLPVLQSLCASNFVYFYTFHGLRGAVPVQSAGRDLLLAALAGAVNVILTTPLWVVNTRLKMGNTPYKTLWGGLAHVSRTEGAQGLWASALPSLLLVCNPALQFMAYEALKRRVAPRGKALPALLQLAVGACAKAVATILTYPIQVAQARMRNGASGSALPILMNLVKRRGLKGLFSGLEAKLMQTVLTAALMFAAYEKIARFVFSLLQRNPRVMLKH